MTRPPVRSPVAGFLGHVLSIQVGKAKSHGNAGAVNPLERPWRSAFFKEPVSGPVAVGPLGLAGDEQADRKHHGGPDLAVLMYCGDHYPAWSAEHGLASIGPGGFAENLTVTGCGEPDVCVGDRLRVGRNLVLEVSQPRQPCSNIDRRWRRQGVMAATVATGRGGWYLRVLQPGEVRAGDEVVLLERPFPGLTVAVANDAHYDRCRDRGVFEALLACPALTDGFKRSVRAGLAKLEKAPDSARAVD